MKQQAEDLVADLRAAFRRMLKQANWLDEHTREGALAKLQEMRQLVAFEDWLLDDYLLDREHGFTGPQHDLAFVKDHPDLESAAAAQHVLEEDEDVLPIVKAADKLSAYIKCVEEQKAGNTEFDSAARQTLAALEALDSPELSWFMENCLGAFSLNLDQL